MNQQIKCTNTQKALTLQLDNWYFFYDNTTDIWLTVDLIKILIKC